MENFKKSFTDIKDEIISFKEVTIRNLQNENERMNDVLINYKKK